MVALGASAREKTCGCGPSPVSKLPNVKFLHTLLLIKASYGRKPDLIPSVVDKNCHKQSLFGGEVFSLGWGRPSHPKGKENFDFPFCEVQVLALILYQLCVCVGPLET